ncbi:hypothetical protein [Peptostreptococcus sp. D1]|uniref:hypothetical protein n=1 Tax=Peptostreptococcus sp. D1 TaxID=72304 RepID=UPI0008E64D01|nr:hypothetical protein [Peptostreptococcus sp. D1]SFE44178.1 hypothetical protein SAMN02910278_00850 [Peptostreptococcus sp. D1]
MSNFYKLITINLKRDKALLVFASLLGFLISGVFTFIICLISNYNMQNFLATSESIVNNQNVGQIIMPNILIGLIPFILVLLCILFIVIASHSRLYNDDGSTYMMIQLPVRKEYHCFIFFLEITVFMIIQYIVAYLCLFIYFKYLMHILAQYGAFYQFTLFDDVSGFGDFVIKIRNYNTVFCILEDFVYRILVTIPAIAAFFMFMMINVYKYGKKFLIALFIIILFVVVFSPVLKLTQILYYGLVILIAPLDRGSLINSLALLIGYLFYSMYFYKNKLDF